MKLPLSWLKEYVDWNISPEEFVEKMMWRGFEVASVERDMEEIENVVVGKILKLEKHPNADKLQLCTMDVGSGAPILMITGATNVFEGALVPVALDGAKLVGGVEIKSTTMRGVKSDGMLCSGEELGLTEADYPGASVYGILILHEDYPLGMPIQEALQKNDIVFDIELTPNRPDCQSIIGMAREVAAALGQPFHEPEIKPVRGKGQTEDYARVTVLNSELCPRYTARVVTDLRIAPSPLWMQKKLYSVGLRPINNIVDITNYVMVEYGHPMHAFDLATVAEGHIVVRNAHEGEVVRTLDSKDRPVTPDMLLIADPTKGVGIAGVMGGENSEITENTKATLFESAVFKGSNIRATTRRLRHTTDAAARYIKGTEPVNAKKALDRAIELVEALDAGTVIGDVVDVCAAELKDREIDVDVAHINRILHTDIAVEKMVEMLSTLHIPAEARGETLHVRIPHYRVDIEDGVEADWDIAEEIGRVYGFYNIEPTLMHGDTFRGRLSEETRDDDLIKDTMVSQGCYEMYNLNFMGPATLDALLLPEGDEKRLAVKLLNPFGEEQSLMRTTLVPGMLESVARNCNRKTGQTRFFEVGNVHLDNNDDLPEERNMLGLAFSGAEEDFFTLKGALEALFERFGLLPRVDVKPGGSVYLQSGQKAVFSVDGEVIGEMGAVHPKVQKAFGIGQRVYTAEIDVRRMRKYKDMKKSYKALPRFPTVPRDIAVVVDEALTNAELLDAIRSAPLQVLLEDLSLFDVYRGKGIPEGKKSMAYTFTLRDPARTLTEEDISAAMQAILDCLAKKTGAELRA